jgi:Vitamin B6 photo-protection and homoeostasis
MILGIYIARTLQKLHIDTTSTATTTAHNDNNSNTTISSYSNWILFVLLTALHIWANWKGVSILRLRTLNRARADVLLQPIINYIIHTQSNMSNDTTTASSSSSSSTTTHTALIAEVTALIQSPDHIYESLIRSSQYIFDTGKITLTCQLKEVMEIAGDTAIMTIQIFEKEKYVLTCTDTTSSRGSIHVYVCLLAGATNRDEIKAYLHATVLINMSHQIQSKSNDVANVNTTTSSGTLNNIERIQQSYRAIQFLFPANSNSNENNDDGENNEDDDNDKNNNSNKNNNKLDTDWFMQQLHIKGWEILDDHQRLHLGFARYRSTWNFSSDISNQYVNDNNNNNNGIQSDNAMKSKSE